MTRTRLKSVARAFSRGKRAKLRIDLDQSDVQARHAARERKPGRADAGAEIDRVLAGCAAGRGGEQDRVMADAVAAFGLAQPQAAAEHGVVAWSRSAVSAHRDAVRAPARRR